MCAVSMIGDHYKDKWTDPFWPHKPLPYPTYPSIPIGMPPWTPIPPLPIVPKPLSSEEAVKRAIDITKKAQQETKIEEEMEIPVTQVSRQEFESLRKEVLEMKELLKRAKKYDEDNNEPDCEIDEKVDLLKKIAAAVGVSLDDVFGKKNS